MTLIYLSFNAYKLNLRFYDKWTTIQKTFRTSILHNSYNRLKYVFQNKLFTGAIQNINFATEINKNMKFYFIWEYLVHFSVVSLN